jgi:hypothetical protein
MLLVGAARAIARKSVFKKRGRDLMKKYLLPAMFLFLIAIAFSGTVSAEATIDTYYINEDGDEITTAQVNDNIEYLAEVQNDGTQVDDATVMIDVNSNIYWGNYAAYESLDGGTTWTENPSSVTRVGDVITWDIGTLAADQLAILNFHGTMLNAGVETLTATVYDGETVMDSSVATLTVTEPATAQGASTVAASSSSTGSTVPMQETGTPLALLALAFGLVSTGLVYSKKQQ